jgi:hypothetical protein
MLETQTLTAFLLAIPVVVTIYEEKKNKHLKFIFFGSNIRNVHRAQTKMKIY